MMYNIHHTEAQKKMKRSQIYLAEEQWHLLHKLSQKTKRSIAELIREAIDYIYTKKKVDFKSALMKAYGIWKDRKDLPSTEEYVRQLRKDTRLKRFYGESSR